MKAEFLNPFIYAGFRVFASEAGIKRLVPGKPYLIRADATLHPVNVVVGVSGSVQGLVIYGMDLAMAKSIIQAMAGSAIPITDPMAESALGELANVITGVAAGSLENGGYPCRISPPAIVKGTGIKFYQSTIPMVVVPISTEIGDTRIYLNLNAVGPVAATRG